jgi:hypothetical protein
MALPTNALQNVQTYQKSGLAYLLNLCAFVNQSNKKFKDFNKMVANLGDTVTFDLPPRYSTNDGLVATFQDSAQRVQSLTVDKAKNTAFAFSAEQFILNVEDYMQNFGKSAISELGAKVEADVATNCITHTYRYYGDGTTAIDSYEQLAQALAFFRNYGAAKDNTKGFISDIAVPAIVGTGLTEFALNRNNEIANSWQLGRFSNAEWFQSNLLPIHTAGTVGEAATTLVITAVVTDPDGGISAITCSGAGADADAIKENDLLKFQDGVSGQPNVRYLTFIGHEPSANPVQIRATADAASVTDSVTIPIYPKLYSAAGKDQNVNNTIAIGMELKALPSHRAGVIYSGNPLYLAMPMLPDESPFMTINTNDPDTGVSLRMYHGSKFGENERGTVYDVIWGSTLVDEYAMRLVFPL